MKYLTHYSQQGVTDLLNKYGAFFAFSDSQLNEHKKEGVEYVSCGMGLICPKEFAMNMMKGLKENAEKARAEDIAENGKENIIIRELANHEAYYTGDIEQTYDAVKSYGFTEDEVLKVFYSQIKLQRLADEA